MRSDSSHSDLVVVRFVYSFRLRTSVFAQVIPIAAQMFFRRVNRLDRDFFEFFFSFTGQIFAHSYSNFTRLKNIWAAIGIT